MTALETDLPRRDAREAAREVFARTMFLVAVTVGVAAAGAWIGRDLSGTTGLIFMLVGLGLLIALNFVRRERHSVTMGLLFAVGLALGLGLGPTIGYYTSLPGGSTLVAQAAGATGLFIAGFGAAGYAIRRDLSPFRRVFFFALLALIVFGIVLIFVTIPGGSLIYAILGLGVFAGLTLLDFNRLRRAQPDDAVLIAASIFLDVLNVFLFFLRILGASR